MRLYVGGFGESKLSYVKNVEKTENIFDGETDDIDDISNYKVVNKFNLLIKRLLINGEDVGKFVDTLDVDVVICDIVGNGVIPIDKDEEVYRNTVGRCCCQLAEKSDRVIRIFCGIGQVIK